MDDSNSPLKKWTIGALLPIALLWQGGSGIATQHFYFGRRHEYIVTGSGAIAAGLAAIFLAFVFHLFTFWKDKRGSASWADPLSLLSIVAFIGSAGYCVYVVFFTK